MQKVDAGHESLKKERSEEVAHIIEHMPTRFGLAVTGVIIILVTVMLLFGWLIEYPDILKGDIVLNNRQAPVKLVSNNSGRIVLFADTSSEVAVNEYIAIIRNPAETKDVRLVDSLLKRIDIHHVDYQSHRHYFPESVSIGELNQEYFGFLSALHQYLDYYHEGSFDKQKDSREAITYAKKAVEYDD